MKKLIILLLLAGPFMAQAGNLTKDSLIMISLPFVNTGDSINHFAVKKSHKDATLKVLFAVTPEYANIPPIQYLDTILPDSTAFYRDRLQFVTPNMFGKFLSIAVPSQISGEMDVLDTVRTNTAFVEDTNGVKYLVNVFWYWPDKKWVIDAIVFATTQRAYTYESRLFITIEER